MKIGVLAVQGNFREHAAMLRRLGAEVVEVRKPEQLDGLDGLVIPGGESTTFMRLMRLYGLDEAVRDFGGPMLGTCAGMIVLDRNHLGLVDLEVDAERVRAPGARASRPSSTLEGETQPLRGVFIRRRRGSRRRARASRCWPSTTASRCCCAKGACSSPRSTRS